MCVSRCPAGIAVDKHGFIYFVDGSTIRKIDDKGVITTIIGSNGLTSSQPISCDSRMDISQVIKTHTHTHSYEFTYGGSKKHLE